MLDKINSREIYIIGASLYGEVIFELAEHCGFKVKGFYDDNPKKHDTKIFGVPVIGSTKKLFSNKKNVQEINFAVAIGHNKYRRGFLEKVRQLSGKTPNLIHKTVQISPSAEIGMGIYINAYTIIWTGVKVENDCLFSPHVLISHHAVLKKGCFVANMSVVGMGVVIESDVLVGMGSTIMSGIKSVGRNTIIGAGSVVIRDVSKNSVMAGVPAKCISRIKE